MRVAERVHLVGRGSWGGHQALSGEGDCNIYIIDGGPELALVDVGIGPNVRQVWRNVKQLGFDPKNITKVLLTHTHWDHTGALPSLRKLSKAAVYAHPYGAQAVKELHPHLGAGPAAKKLGPARARRLFRIDRTVREGDRVQVGDLAVQVLELPGHTPDCLGWLLTVAGERILFSGDAAIGDQPTSPAEGADAPRLARRRRGLRRPEGGGKVKGCIGWLDVHWGSDLAAFSRTLSRLCRRKFDVLCPGHGLAIVGRARVARSLRHCRQRLENFRRFPQLGSMTPLQPATDLGNPRRR